VNINGINLSAYAALAGASFTGAVYGTSVATTGAVAVGGTVSVGSDASLNGRLYVASDASMSGGLTVTKMLTASGGLTIPAGQTLNVTGVNINGINLSAYAALAGASFTGAVYGTSVATTGAVAAGGVLSVGSDASLNGRLFVVRDVSVNGNIAFNGLLQAPANSIPSNAVIGGAGSATFTNTQAQFSINNSKVVMVLDNSAANTLDISGALSISTAIGVGVTNPQFQVDVGSGGIGCGRFVQFGPGTSALPTSSVTTNIIAGTFNGPLSTTADTSLNGRLFVTADASLNSRIFLGSDASLGGRLFVTGDSSLNGNMVVGKNLTVVGAVSLPSNSIPTTAITGMASYATLAGATFTGSVYTPALYSSGLHTVGAGLTVVGGATFSGAVYANTGLSVVGSDASLNGRLFVGLDTSANGNLSLGGSLVVNGNLTVNRNTTSSIINTITTNVFAVVDDLSLNGRIYTSGDVSCGGRLFTIGDASLNGRLFVVSDVSVNGNMKVAGNVTALAHNTTSDYRVKLDVHTLDGTYVVDRLRPVAYTNTLSNKKDIGFLAHEIQEEYPYLVNGEKDAEALQSVNYTGLIGVLVKEIQEMKGQISVLTDKAEANEREIAVLKSGSFRM